MLVLKLLILGLAIFASFTASVQAANTPGFVLQEGKLWYQTAPDGRQEFSFTDLRDNKKLRRLSRPITFTKLIRIPLGVSPKTPALQDTDQDGLDDEYEKAFGTNPKRKDSDRDGFSDRAEILSGYHPLLKGKKMIVHQTTYDRYKGQVVWEPTRKQLWYISPQKPQRFYLPSRQILTWTDLQALATSVSSTSPTPLFTADCRPENCTRVDWKIRARALPIPDYQRAIDKNGRLVMKSGKFQVIMPDDTPNAEEFGRIYLYHLKRQYDHTEHLFGRAPFLLPTTVTEEFVLNLFASGACCGPEEDGYPSWGNMGSREEYLQKMTTDHPQTEYERTGDWSHVLGNHELSHRFVFSLGLHSFLDEGLANYAQDHGAPQQPTVCGSGGYTAGDVFKSYKFLSCSGDDGTWRPYESGDCFWQRIEAKYGLEMVRRIISRLYNLSEREAMRGAYYATDSPEGHFTSAGQLWLDLNQAFVPEIGERFWEDFKDFGLSPIMNKNVTVETEAAQCRK